MKANDQSLLLRKFNLWSDLSDEEYEKLDVADNFREVKQGEYIYFEAYHHNYIYFVKKGHILLGKIDDSGSVITKDILREGDFLGQVTLEKDNLDGEFAQAIKSNVCLCSFTIEKFTTLLKENPSISIKYSKLVGLRLRKFENRLINIVQKDARTRLLLFLGELLNERIRQAPVYGDTARIPSYLTHEEIARLIGASRQTVTTIFNELKEEGVLEYSRKEIKFLSYKKHFGEGMLLPGA